MKRTSMFFDDGQVEQLQELSERTGQSVAKLVRRATDLFLLLMASTGGVAEAVQIAQQVFDDADTPEWAACRALVRWKHDREENSLRGGRLMKIGCDIDGTLLDYNYTPGAIPAVNRSLIRQLRERTDSLALITNQGGLPWGLQGATRKDGRQYPKPSDFVGRFVYLVGTLALHGIAVSGLSVCVYHPKATAEAIGAAKVDLFRQLDGLIFNVYHEPQFRKPGPGMLLHSGIDCYYGDSDEDEQAAQAAGCDFVRVERFFR